MIQPVLDEPESLVVLELLVAVGEVVVAVPLPVAPDPLLAPFPVLADPLPVDPAVPLPPDPPLVEPPLVVPVPVVPLVGVLVVVPGAAVAGGVVVVSAVPLPGFASGLESTGHVPSCSHRDSVGGGGSVWMTGGTVADGWVGGRATAAVAMTTMPAAVAATPARRNPIRRSLDMATSRSFLPPGPRRRPRDGTAFWELMGRTARNAQVISPRGSKGLPLRG
jgi:hypothetical protein